jgi:transcriptional regulator with XRE-family HTH domain
MGEPLESAPDPAALALAGEVRRGLGRALLRARTDAGLTQSELGARAGISGAMVSRYEAGVNGPPLESLVAMAVALGASLDRLTGLAGLRSRHAVLALPAGLPADLADALGTLARGLDGYLAAARPDRVELRHRIEPVLLRCGVAAFLAPAVADEIARLVPGAAAGAAAPDRQHPPANGGRGSR